MPSLFQILKTSKLGPQAAPDMLTALVAKNRAGDGKIRTLTGIPPLSFRANGKPLISWSMKGNGQQSGTPTPDNPVMPTFCGVRTGNLFDLTAWLVSKNASYTKDGNKYTFSTVQSMYNDAWFFSEENVVVSISGILKGVTAPNPRIDLVNADGTIATTMALNENRVKTENISCAGLRFNWSAKGAISVENLMLNLGSTALPYEPFGWAEKITCAGQTTPVYLGQVSTVRKVRKTAVDISMIITLPNGNKAGIHAFSSEQYAVQGLGFCDIALYDIARRTTGMFYVNRQNAVFVGDSSDTFATLQDKWNSANLWYVLETQTTGIVNEPLAKIGDYADELNSTDAGVTIPTVRGQNTLTVDTELQPSEMTITGHIKQMQFVYVTDSDGVYCFDSDGVQIVEEV